MEACKHICSRYDIDNRANFEAPDSIWDVSDSNLGILGTCALSISCYALGVIGNIHNSVMSSEHPKWAKIAIVLLLDAASLAIIALALPETLIRTAIGVACIPFFLLAACVGSDTARTVFITPLVSAIITFAQIPNAFLTVCTLTLSPETINPEKNGFTIFHFITCDTFN